VNPQLQTPASCANRTPQAAPAPCHPHKPRNKETSRFYRPCPGHTSTRHTSTRHTPAHVTHQHTSHTSTRPTPAHVPHQHTSHTSTRPTPAHVPHQHTSHTSTRHTSTATNRAVGQYCQTVRAQIRTRWAGAEALAWHPGHSPGASGFCAAPDVPAASGWPPPQSRPCQTSAQRSAHRSGLRSPAGEERSHCNGHKQQAQQHQQF